MTEVVVTKEIDHVLVKINRPERHNALNPLIIRELADVFRNISTDPLARAVVLRGAGASFCSGGDLEWMRSMANYKFEENLTDAEGLYNMYDAIASCPLPVIGYVQGNAFGGGVGLVAVCDVAVAEESARFCFSEARLGIVPAVISSFVARKMHANKLREYMLTAQAFGALDAKASGLVEFVGRELEAHQYVEKTLKHLHETGPEAVRETKRLLDFNLTHTRDQIRAESIRVIAERRVSKEGQDGISSFLNKHKPSWVKH